MRSALLTSITFLAGAAPLFAQQAAPAQESHIMGFRLVPWGARANDVETAYGKPLMERIAADSGTVLIYRDAASMFSLFYIDKTKGLVRGVSSIPYGPGPACESIFQKSRASIERVYPSLKPVEIRKQDDPKVPFCDAAAAGKASWSISWTDPASGNSARVTLQSDEKLVEITYQSGSYRSESN